jgi:beta-glucosidase
MFSKKALLLALAMTQGCTVVQANVVFDHFKNNAGKYAAGAAATMATAAAGGFYGYKRVQEYIATEDNAATLETSKHHENWDKIEAENQEFLQNPHDAFPADFTWGAGTSYYQVEGAAENTDQYNWQIDEQGNQRVQHLIGNACDSWNRWREDIDAAHEIGLNQYRFSIDWSKVEPTPGVFDQTAIDRYKEMVTYIRSKGMTELIGFHHYADPQWFAEKEAFTKKENIKDFVRFCTRMVQEIGHAPGRLWATFNSPTGYAFPKYHQGIRVPGIKGNTQLTMEVLKNMAKAHWEVSKACKAVNPNFQIGILLNIMHLDPWREGHLADENVCKIGDKMQNECIFNFFTTGKFAIETPVELDSIKMLPEWMKTFIRSKMQGNGWYARIVAEDTNENVSESLDFIGINHYSHMYMKNAEKVNVPFETKTQNENYTIYPEGMYRAIKLIHEKMVQPIKAKTGKEIPVYVTENGVSHDDPQVRLKFFQRTMYMIKKAMDDGYPVHGYTYWSLLDNYEWGSYDKKYGLVHVDFPIGGNGTLNRTIKTDIGTNWFRNLVTNYKQRFTAGAPAA